MKGESGSRILELKYKLATIELLNLAKNYYTYRELSQIVGLPETVLSRYIKGHVLPTIKRAESINSLLQNVLRLDTELEKRIVFDDSGYFDNTEIISDPLLLGRAVQYGINKFAGKRITKVVTAAVDGVPLATLLAYRLGVSLVIAKKEREVGVKDFIEEVFIPQKTAVMMSLYAPKGSIKKGDCVLIVDDVIDSGETQKALIRIVQKAKAEVTGIYALIAIGDEWKEKISEVANCPVEVVLQIPRKKV
ncbi:MAG: phosphoribosyltransferase family protein [Candidatus Bathyarchaeia archaeon]|nr:adenine phosphoribosyltransferase [Candidatus Bathyarchaeota archaeon]